MVQEYTLGQVRAYSGAIDRARRRREREAALLQRAAFHYDSDQFKAFLKE